jgi:hypothetical protein
MNAVDIVQLKLFLAELSHARVSEKDRRADALIRLALERQPDATYVLVQRVMQLESALHGARAGAALVARTPRVPDGSARPAAETRPRQSEPWWRKVVPGFAGTAFLLQSTEYLLGDRETSATSPGAL